MRVRSGRLWVSVIFVSLLLLGMFVEKSQITNFDKNKQNTFPLKAETETNSGSHLDDQLNIQWWAQPEGTAVPKQGVAKTTSILLLGLDSREGEPARADSIMLAVLNPAKRTIRVLSIPRDTYVQVPGHGKTKINHAMAYGGSRLMKKTVEEWLQVPVDDTVVIDFRGFSKLVDLLGGIQVQVEKNMDYDDPSDGTSIHLAVGDQRLSGKQALDYARFRHDPEADTGRMRRQRQVLKAIAEKGMSLDTLPKLFTIRQIIGHHLHVTMTSGEILRIAAIFRGVQPEEIQAETMRGVNKVASSDGLWYFFVENSERERISQLLSEWLRGNE